MLEKHSEIELKRGFMFSGVALSYSSVGSDNVSRDGVIGKYVVGHYKSNGLHCSRPAQSMNC